MNRQNKSSAWRQKPRRTSGFLWQISGRDHFINGAVWMRQSDTLILPARSWGFWPHIFWICSLVESLLHKSENPPTRLLMEEILHQLIGRLSHCLQGFYTSQVVQDFFHQQYHWNVPQTLSYLEGNPFILLCFGDIWFVCSWDSWGLERKFLRIKSWSAGARGNGRIPPMTEIL